MIGGGGSAYFSDVGALCRGLAEGENGVVAGGDKRLVATEKALSLSEHLFGRTAPGHAGFLRLQTEGDVLRTLIGRGNGGDGRIYQCQTDDVIHCEEGNSDGEKKKAFCPGVKK